MADLDEQGSNREHQRSSQSCGVVELAGHRENILLGDWSRRILEKIGVLVSSGGNSAGFLVEIEAELQEIMIFETIPGHSKILADSVFTRAFPGFYAKPTFAEDFPHFILELRDFTCRAGSDASIVDVGILQYSLEDGRLEIRRRVLDEHLNGQDLCTSGVIAGGAVAKGNGSVTEEIPGGVRRRRAGEGVRRNTDNSEEGVSITSAHRSEELLDVVD